MRIKFSNAAFILAVIANVNFRCDESKAAAENGMYNIKIAISCKSFLEAYKEEDLERSQIMNPESGVFYNKIFHSHAYYILGFVAGANLFAGGFKEVLPFDHLTILDLVKRRCEAEPENNVANATEQVIWNNMTRWKKN